MPPYESILNSLEEAVLLFDRKGRLLYLNRLGEELFGRSLRDLMDRGVNGLFTDSCDIPRLVKKTLDEGRPHKSRDIRLKGLRDTSMDVYICPLYEEAAIDTPHQGKGTNSRQDSSLREPKGALLCLRDNSYLSDREDYHFDSLLYLLGSIAHEIKNPLSGIKGAAQILGSKMPLLQEDECIKMILKETDRLNTVLQSYLTMTRKPVFNTLNIHEVLEHSLKVLSPVIKSKFILINKSYDPSLPHISGDESKLLQVFINLFKNATESLSLKKKNREISVSSRLSNEYVVIYDTNKGSVNQGGRKRQRWIIITIRDNGPGIDAEDQKRIFLPFYTNKKGGSGLGLSLSKKIIKDHGGIIKLKSQIEKGAAFDVYLPIRMES